MAATRSSWMVLALVLVAVGALWGTWVVYPLKILVVFFHELAHGVAAVLTGGRIVEIQLDPREGGQCITRGGWRFVVLSAGYLGSLLAGGLLLLGAAHSRRDRAITAFLGVLLLGVTVAFVRPWFGFGMLFGLGAGGALLLAARYLGDGANDVLLVVIGVTSCLYAVLDIKSDVLDRPQAASDARMLAEATGVPTVLWGLVWALLALVGTFAFLRAALRARATPPPPGAPGPPGARA